MKAKQLQITFLILTALTLMGGRTFAQSSINLYMGMGINTIDNYDLGTVPYHLHGGGRVQDWGANIAWKRCQIQFDGRYFNSNLITLTGTNQGLDFNTEFLYRYHDTKSSRFHFYTGAALEGYGEVKSVPDLLNASFCMNVFGNICDVNMVQWDFAFNKAKTHHWLTAYGKLTLPIVGIINRPGYSYTYDSQGMDYIERFFAGHETFIKFFPGCSTDFGLWLNLKNSNRIGLNYRWDYLSTGKEGVWRYDNAYHSVNLSFMFNIK